ncbi:hypothetical protein NMG60_11028480 [Bertholletia excelsa]
MVFKRPFHDEVHEETYEVGYKHPRQEEHSAKQSPIVGILTSSDDQEQFSGKGENSARKSEDEGKVVQETLGENLNEADRETQINASGNSSSYLWDDGNDINDYADSEASVQLSFFPHYFELDHHVTALVQPQDIYSVLLDHPPRKQVCVGSEHQADIPEWNPNYLSKLSCSHVVHNRDDGDWAKLAGTCIIPMPDKELSSDSFCLDGGTIHHCNCLDRGSINCVRQHIREAREELRENLGQNLFEELGFCDMGEVVANKWTEEEEEMFHEVILSNSPSEDKNFWDHLSTVFPLRTKKELVSYYFNVFMLRKRAEQNRFDPLNIDSDNDEWQISEPEQDDDSVVESTDQVASAHNQENDEEELEAIGKQGEDINEENEGDINNMLAAHVGNFVGTCGMDNPVFDLSGKISSHDGQDQDIHDDSCTQ